MSLYYTASQKPLHYFSTLKVRLDLRFKLGTYTSPAGSDQALFYGPLRATQILTAVEGIELVVLEDKVRVTTPAVDGTVNTVSYIEVLIGRYGSATAADLDSVVSELRELATATVFETEYTTAAAFKTACADTVNDLGGLYANFVAGVRYRVPVASSTYSTQHEALTSPKVGTSGYDYGVRGDGVTDSTAGLTAAAAAAGAYGLVALPPGDIYLASSPTVSNVMLQGSGVSLSASVPGVSDLTALGVSGKWFTMHLSTAGSAVAGSANQHGMTVQAATAVSNSTVNYQKNGLYVRALHNDPSNGSTTTRDLVAAAHMGYVAATNTQARLWATQSLVQVNSGGDGLVYGHEIELYNYGSAQTAVGTTTSKYGLHLVAGAGVGSAAIWMNSKAENAGSIWENGIYIDDDAINTSAMRFGASKFAVSASGFVGVGVPSPTVQLDMEGATNCRARFTGSGGSSAIYTTYLHKATRAFTTGLDTASQEFRITGSEGLANNVLFRSKTNGDMAFRNSAPIAKPTVTGSRAGNAALASLLTALADQGLITDSTTA